MDKRGDHVWKIKREMSIFNRSLLKMTASVFAPPLAPRPVQYWGSRIGISMSLVSDVFFSCQDGPVKHFLSYDED